MKQIKAILLITVIILASAISLQAKVPSEISDALKTGNSNTISSYLNTTVELAIENRNEIFSKQQASGILSDFFNKNSVQDFKIIHEGEKDATSFIVGTLQSSNGSFRVYVLMRNENNKNTIQQLRISSSSNP